MNLPNKLTIIRLVMVPLIILVLLLPIPLKENTIRIIAASLFILASITDFFDGKIARKNNLITNFGIFLDPLADKFMVIGTMISILANTNLEGMFSYLSSSFVWLTIIVIFREFWVTSLRLLVAGSKDKIVVSASMIGKVKTAFQIICISVLLLEPVIFPWFPIFGEKHLLSYITMAIMGILTLWSGIEYTVKYSKYITQ